MPSEKSGPRSCPRLPSEKSGPRLSSEKSSPRSGPRLPSEKSDPRLPSDQPAAAMVAAAMMAAAAMAAAADVRHAPNVRHAPMGPQLAPMGAQAAPFPHLKKGNGRLGVYFPLRGLRVCVWLILSGLVVALASTNHARKALKPDPAHPSSQGRNNPSSKS